METVHYLILGGAAALAAAILFPGFRSKAKAVAGAAVAPSPATASGSFREGVRMILDAAESRAYSQVEDEMVDKRAGKLKAEIQELFSFDQPATATKAAK